MHRLEDYYRILQVHYLAEPEAIESAYKRLAKKYHPDLNKNENSVEMMQKINEAYEELGNPARRQQYHREHEKNEKLFSTAKSVLDEYFRNIINKHFDYSYELISSIDKQNITREDFIKWQCAVSEIFQISEYSCRVYASYNNKQFNGCFYDNIVEFGVSVVEYNAVMDMVEKDTFTKNTLLEDGKWRVFVGIEKLEPLISKFEALKGLLAAKSVINDLVETHSRADSVTGLLNKRGITERIENEIHRFDRYGNIFSLIMCDIDISNDHIIKLVGKILTNNLRKLDVVGRWGDRTFLILLPETRLSSAIKAMEKIREILKTEKLVHNDKTYRASAKFRATEYVFSLEESLSRISGSKI